MGLRSNSASVPLYVKLEKEFEEKFVLPEIDEKKVMTFKILNSNFQ